VAQLRHALPEIHASGAELVVVGCGNRHFAQAFREEMQLTTPLYVDTKRDAYRALGMKRGVLRTVTGGALRNLWRSLRSGSRQKGIKGDPWQQGGVLVVRTDATIAFRHISEEAGDHPSVDAILKALHA
jgi:hypothetical protein